MLKILSLVSLLFVLSCAGQNKVPAPQPQYPWSTLPDDERRFYEVNYKCPEATVRINEVRAWETVEVLEVEPPDFEIRGQMRTVQDPNNPEHDFALLYVYLPRGLTLLYGWDPEEDIAYVDYFALSAGVDETKATGEFFCQAEMTEDIE